MYLDKIKDIIFKNLSNFIQTFINKRLRLKTIFDELEIFNFW